MSQPAELEVAGEDLAAARAEEVARIRALRAQAVDVVHQCDRALTALGVIQERPGRTFRARRGGTWDLARKYAVACGTDRDITMPEAVAWMRANGWTRIPKDAQGAVASAYAHMARRGQYPGWGRVRNVGVGVYRFTPDTGVPHDPHGTRT